MNELALRLCSTLRRDGVRGISISFTDGRKGSNLIPHLLNWGYDRACVLAGTRPAGSGGSGNDLHLD